MKTIKFTLFFIMLAQLVWSRPKFHLITIGMSEISADYNILPSVKVDIFNIKHKFCIISNILEMDFRDINYNYQDLNMQNLSRLIDSIKVEPQDKIVFYFSGYGLKSKSNNQFPFIVRQERFKDIIGVELIDVENLIKTKNPSFSLILADCCNLLVDEKIPVNYPIDYSKILSKDSILGSHLNYASSLESNGNRISKSQLKLFNKNGSVIAAPNGLAKGGQFGGVFTHYFCEMLLRDADNWNNLFQQFNETSLDQKCVYRIDLKD